ncbi:MAG: 50S ribosomal protein L9 [Gemmatimonadales bacterium]
MEVILRQSIDKLGRAGDIVKVRDGYARNYLLPKGLAYPATESHKRKVQEESKRRAHQLAVRKDDAEAQAAALEKVELHFTAKSGEGDKLFGSITSGDIAHKLIEEGFEVDKRAIELEEPIKMIGVYKVPIRLHTDVRAEVRVWVVKE